MKIRPPKFSLYQYVVLYWNGKEIKGKITDRRYSPDKGDDWEYEISGSGKYFWQQNIGLLTD